MKTLKKMTMSSLPILGAVSGGFAVDQIARHFLDSATRIDTNLIPASISASFGAVLIYKEIKRELGKDHQKINGPA